MIELGLLSTKTGFDIAETFAISELSKGQTEELIPAGEIFDVAIALVPIDANLKLVSGEEFHELRENGSALVIYCLRSKLENSRMAPKERQKIEIEKCHRDPLLSFNQAVTVDCSDFLGTALFANH
jgi:hypothetical protein